MKLDNVTLLGINGRDDIIAANEIHKALLISSAKIDFDSIKLFSAVNIDTDFELIDIPPMSWKEYNDFILRDLVDYVDTEFLINLQADGFILNPDLWINEFLDYDYIGAPFSYDLHFGPNSPQYLGDSAKWIHDSVRKKNKEDVNLVGNGGFSLRSKKLLQETANCPFDNFGGPEDVYICANYYDYFVSRGINFAPVELASRFSLNIDMYSDPMEMSRQVFGFHGHKTMIDRY